MMIKERRNKLFVELKKIKNVIGSINSWFDNIEKGYFKMWKKVIWKYKGKNGNGWSFYVIWNWIKE